MQNSKINVKNSETVIEVRDLSKTYLDRKGREVKRALHGATFTLYKGEVFSLLGVNGAGKTTLSSILATMHPPTFGDILWRGESIYNQLLDYRKIVGLCPQEPNIDFRLNLEENLLFAGLCYGLNKQDMLERKNSLMAKFDLGGYSQTTIDQLSGGYRQRFLIARTLMHMPKIVILDEPTVGLDPQVRREIWEMIKALKSEDVSVILTTHYLDEAELLSDRVCLIHHGVIRAIDTPDNFKKQHKKNTLEEVFLKFVDDPEADIFNSIG